MSSTAWQGEFEVEVTVNVRIRIDDTRIVSRINEALWRQQYTSHLNELDDVLTLFAYHAVFDRYSDASDVDGWADLAPGKATFELDPATFEAELL